MTKPILFTRAALAHEARKMTTMERKAILLTRATLALLYQRSGRISAATAEAQFVLFDAAAKNESW